MIKTARSMVIQQAFELSGPEVEEKEDEGSR